MQCSNAENSCVAVGKSDCHTERKEGLSGCQSIILSLHMTERK